MYLADFFWGVILAQTDAVKPAFVRLGPGEEGACIELLTPDETWTFRTAPSEHAAEPDKLHEVAQSRNNTSNT